MIELQLFTKEEVTSGNEENTRQKYIDSNPIKIILNNGVDDNASCEAAIRYFTQPELIEDDSSQLPASGILIMTGP